MRWFARFFRGQKRGLPAQVNLPNGFADPVSLVILSLVTVALVISTTLVSNPDSLSLFSLARWSPDANSRKAERRALREGGDKNKIREADGSERLCKGDECRQLQTGELKSVAQHKVNDAITTLYNPKANSNEIEQAKETLKQQLSEDEYNKSLQQIEENNKFFQVINDQNSNTEQKQLAYQLLLNRKQITQEAYDTGTKELKEEIIKPEKKDNSAVRRLDQELIEMKHLAEKDDISTEALETIAGRLEKYLDMEGVSLPQDIAAAFETTYTQWLNKEKNNQTQITKITEQFEKLKQKIDSSGKEKDYQEVVKTITDKITEETKTPEPEAPTKELTPAEKQELARQLAAEKKAEQMEAMAEQAEQDRIKAEEAAKQAEEQAVVDKINGLLTFLSTPAIDRPPALSSLAQQYCDQSRPSGCTQQDVIDYTQSFLAANIEQSYIDQANAERKQAEAKNAANTKYNQAFNLLNPTIRQEIKNSCSVSSKRTGGSNYNCNSNEGLIDYNLNRIKGLNGEDSPEYQQTLMVYDTARFVDEKMAGCQAKDYATCIINEKGEVAYISPLDQQEETEITTDQLDTALAEAVTAYIEAATPEPAEAAQIMLFNNLASQNFSYQMLELQSSKCGGNGVLGYSARDGKFGCQTSYSENQAVAYYQDNLAPEKAILATEGIDPIDIPGPRGMITKCGNGMILSGGKCYQQVGFLGQPGITFLGLQGFKKGCNDDLLGYNGSTGKCELTKEALVMINNALPGNTEEGSTDQLVSQINSFQLLDPAVTTVMANPEYGFQNGHEAGELYQLNGSWWQILDPNTKTVRRLAGAEFDYDTVKKIADANTPKLISVEAKPGLIGRFGQPSYSCDNGLKLTGGRCVDSFTAAYNQDYQNGLIATELKEITVPQSFGGSIFNFFTDSFIAPAIKAFSPSYWTAASQQAKIGLEMIDTIKKDPELAAAFPNYEQEIYQNLTPEAKVKANQFTYEINNKNSSQPVPWLADVAAKSMYNASLFTSAWTETAASLVGEFTGYQYGNSLLNMAETYNDPESTGGQKALASMAYYGEIVLTAADFMDFTGAETAFSELGETAIQKGLKQAAEAAAETGWKKTGKLLIAQANNLAGYTLKAPNAISDTLIKTAFAPIKYSGQILFSPVLSLGMKIQPVRSFFSGAEGLTTVLVNAFSPQNKSLNNLIADFSNKQDITEKTIQEIFETVQSTFNNNQAGFIDSLLAKLPDNQPITGNIDDLLRRFRNDPAGLSLDELAQLKHLQNTYGLFQKIGIKNPDKLLKAYAELTNLTNPLHPDDAVNLFVRNGADQIDARYAVNYLNQVTHSPFLSSRVKPGSLAKAADQVPPTTTFTDLAEKGPTDTTPPATAVDDAAGAAVADAGEEAAEISMKQAELEIRPTEDGFKITGENIEIFDAANENWRPITPNETVPDNARIRQNNGQPITISRTERDNTIGIDEIDLTVTYLDNPDLPVWRNRLNQWADRAGGWIGRLADSPNASGLLDGLSERENLEKVADNLVAAGIDPNDLDNGTLIARLLDAGYPPERIKNKTVEQLKSAVNEAAETYNASISKTARQLESNAKLMREIFNPSTQDDEAIALLKKVQSNPNNAEGVLQKAGFTDEQANDTVSVLNNQRRLAQTAPAAVDDAAAPALTTANAPAQAAAEAVDDAVDDLTFWQKYRNPILRGVEYSAYGGLIGIAFITLDRAIDYFNSLPEAISTVIATITPTLNPTATPPAPTATEEPPATTIPPTATAVPPDPTAEYLRGLVSLPREQVPAEDLVFYDLNTYLNEYNTLDKSAVINYINQYLSTIGQTADFTFNVLQSSDSPTQSSFTQKDTWELYVKARLYLGGYEELLNQNNLNAYGHPFTYYLEKAKGNFGALIIENQQESLQIYECYTYGYLLSGIPGSKIANLYGESFSKASQMVSKIKNGFESGRGIQYGDNYQRVFLGNFTAYQFEAWDFNNMESKPKAGDTIFYGDHVIVLHRVMFDEAQNKYLFLLSEANSPADGATGEPRIYLIDQNTFEARIEQLDQVYFLRDTHQEPSLDPAYLKPGEAQPTYEPIINITDQVRQNFQKEYELDPQVNAAAVNAAREIVSSCRTGVDGRNNACTGHLFGGETLTADAAIDTSFVNWKEYDEYDSNMFAHCTDLLIDTAVKLGVTELDKQENLAVTNMRNDFLAHSALSGNEQITSGLFAFIDNEPNDTNGALIHAGIVTEVETNASGQVTGFSLSQINSAEANARYTLDSKTGEYFYKFKGEILYADSFGNLDIYQHNSQ